MSRLRGSNYYHRRAEELRLAAREPCSLDNRDTLLYFAADLDELADEAAKAKKQLRENTKTGKQVQETQDTDRH